MVGGWEALAHLHQYSARLAAEHTGRLLASQPARRQPEKTRHRPQSTVFDARQVLAPGRPCRLRLEEQYLRRDAVQWADSSADQGWGRDSYKRHIRLGLRT